MKKHIIIIALVLVAGIGISYLLFFSSRRAPRDVETLHRSYELLIDPDTKDPNYILHNPVAIRIGLDHNIYILDQGNSRIMVYDENMKFVRQIGRKGQGPGELIEPTDFDFDREGNVYVAEFTNLQVSIFKKDGSFLKALSPPGLVVPREFQLAVSSEGLIYVNTFFFGDSLITVFDEDGRKVRAFGEIFEHPKFRGARHDWNTVYLDFDEMDNLWVVYQTKPLIRKYSKEGTLLFEREPTAPDIEAGKRKEKPWPPERYINYFTDVICTGEGRIFVSGHNYVYEFNAVGDMVRQCVVDYPKWREQTRYFFVNRFTYHGRKKVFYAVSAYDDIVYRF